MIEGSGSGLIPNVDPVDPEHWWPLYNSSRKSPRKGGLREEREEAPTAIMPADMAEQLVDDVQEEEEEEASSEQVR